MKSLDELEKTLLQLKKQIEADCKKIKELEEIIKELYEYNRSRTRDTNSSSN